MSRSPPGPSGYPVIGNMMGMVREPLEFRQRCQRYGDVVRVQAGPIPWYMVTHPDYVEEVLVTKSEQFIKPEMMRDRLDGVFGKGLLLSDGEFWETERKLTQSAFVPGSVAHHDGMMSEYAARKAGEWQPGETYDIAHEMKTLTFRILVQAIFSRDISYDDFDMDKAVEGVRAKYDPSNPSFYIPDWVPTPVNRRYHAGIDTLDAVIEELLSGRRGRDDATDDLFADLLAARNDPDHQMDEEVLRDEMRTLLLGGIGRTAMAITYTWYLLSHNPEKRAAFHDELEAVLGGARPTFENLADLEYTEQVLKESMRLYPPVWTIGREPVEDVEVGGYTLPEGAAVNLTPWVVHRDERWYDDPEAFRPERWTPERERDRPQFAYFPFGGGPRQCLGFQFAMIESQLILATIAQEYEFEHVGDSSLDLTISTTLEPDSVPMTVRER